MIIVCKKCHKNSFDMEELGSHTPEGWWHLGNALLLTKEEGLYFCSDSCIVSYFEEWCGDYDQE